MMMAVMMMLYCAPDADRTVQHRRTSSVCRPQVHITGILRSLWLHDLWTCSPWAPVQRYDLALLYTHMIPVLYMSHIWML